MGMLVCLLCLTILHICPSKDNTLQPFATELMNPRVQWSASMPYPNLDNANPHSCGAWLHFCVLMMTQFKNCICMHNCTQGKLWTSHDELIYKHGRQDRRGINCTQNTDSEPQIQYPQKSQTWIRKTAIVASYHTFCLLNYKNACWLAILNFLWAVTSLSLINAACKLVNLYYQVSFCFCVFLCRILLVFVFIFLLFFCFFLHREEYILLLRGNSLW